ncbi:3-deoxy-D-manno-octulosonic acid kinase [Wenzhouxiangella sp. EGI_FJ10409]|uniref:3-deoxy-D-manno-octulosonic acid kinase n=1 Tax=Wenzhouxiangella sp. EGI_FJ10409 TaxID=3243767 RepID=UPI0035DBC53C
MPTELQAGSTRILYDPSALDVVSPEWLDPGFWRLRDAVLAEFGGRGQALAVATGAGPAVLRRYLRGGMIARVSRERYFFTGYQRSRSFREFRVLDRLRRMDLPVPEPLIASCERRGATYRAAILTRLLENAISLPEAADILEPEHWQRLGATLGRFFRAGVVHPDLNASNLLIDGDCHWHLIDFDRARIENGPVDPEPMLKRLERSLDKLGITGERALLYEAVTRLD